MIAKLLVIIAFMLASTDINNCFSKPYSNGSWIDAQNHCRNKGGKLQAPPLDANGRFWTPFYKRYSNWIQLLGCYNESYIGMTITSKTETMKIPSAGMCQEICKANGNSRFAVQNHTCKCLNSSIKSASLQPSACSYRCNEKVDPIALSDCGGPSAYNSFLSDDNRPLTTRERCASVVCNEAYQRYHQHNCSIPNAILCRGKEKTLNEFKPWRKAWDRCKYSSRSYLLGDLPLGEAREICKVINVTLTGPTWIGSVTQIYISSDRGEIIEDKKIINECEGCTIGDANRKTCGFSLCNYDYQFSCEKIQPTTTTKRATPLPRTQLTIQPTITAKAATTLSTKQQTIQPTTTTKAAATLSTKQSAPTKPTTAVATDVAQNTTRDSHINRDSSEQESNEHGVLVGILITVTLLIVVGIVMGVICLKRHRRRANIPKNVEKEGLNVELPETQQNRNDESGNSMNNNYFELESPMSNHEVPGDIEQEGESPYNDGEEGTYDHLRDKEARRKTTDNVYQHGPFLQNNESSDYDIAGRTQNRETENPYYDHANGHNGNSHYVYNTLDHS